jgi:hypothetical protein
MGEEIHVEWLSFSYSEGSWMMLGLQLLPSPHEAFLPPPAASSFSGWEEGILCQPPVPA